MNRVERRIRNLVNPYSTAFAEWWCHAGRHTRPARVIMLIAAARGSRHRATGEGALEAFGPPATSMADRRAAVDAVLARLAGEGRDSVV